MEIQNQLRIIKLLARMLQTNVPPNKTFVSIGFSQDKNDIKVDKK